MAKKAKPADVAPEVAPSAPAESEPRRLVIDYIKSNYFRVVHADGVIGGLTPGLGIHLAFFNERAPIPQQVTYKINEDQTLGSEVREERVEKKGVVREVEVDVVMDADTVTNLVAWLQERLADYRKAAAKIQNKG